MKNYKIGILLFLNVLFSTTIVKSQPDIKHSLYFKDKKCTKDGILNSCQYQHSNGRLFSIQLKQNGSASNIDICLSKLNNNFDTVWQKCYGGSEEDRINKILELPNHNLLLVGTTSSNDGDVSYGHAYSALEIWLMEVDTNGTFIKGKTFGGSNSSGVTSSLVSNDGNIYLSGATIANDYDFLHINNGQFDVDPWIAKLDTAFNIKWIKFYSGDLDESAAFLELVSANKIIVQFGTESMNAEMLPMQAKGDGDVILRMIDSNGGDIWVKRIGSSGLDGGNQFVIDHAHSICYLIGQDDVIADGDITYTTGYQSCWVVKIDTLGNILGSKAYGITTNDGMIIRDAIFYNNHIYINADTDGGGGDAEINVGTTSNVWIGMIDTNVNLVGKYTINESGNDYGGNFFTYNNELYLSGYSFYKYPNTFGCTPNDTIFNYVVNIGIAPLLIQSINNEKEKEIFQIYPNPNSENINIEILEEGKYELQIISSEGKLMTKQKSKMQKEQIDCHNWNPGIYYIKLKQNNKTQTKQFIKK